MLKCKYTVKYFIKMRKAAEQKVHTNSVMQWIFTLKKLLFCWRILFEVEFFRKNRCFIFSARKMPANWRFGWKFIKFNNKQHTKLVFQWVRLSNTSSWDNCFWKHIRRKEIKGVKWKMKKPRNSFMLQPSTHVKGLESFTFRLYIQFPMPVWNQ